MSRWQLCFGALVTLIIFLDGAWGLVVSARISLAGLSTQGIVIDRGIITDSSDYEITGPARIDFRDEMGTLHHTSNYSFLSHAVVPTTGSPVGVRYLRSDPEVNTLDNDWEILWCHLALIGIALFVAGRFYWREIDHYAGFDIPGDDRQNALRNLPRPPDW